MAAGALVVAACGVTTTTRGRDRHRDVYVAPIDGYVRATAPTTAGAGSVATEVTAAPDGTDATDATAATAASRGGDARPAPLDEVDRDATLRFAYGISVSRLDPHRATIRNDLTTWTDLRPTRRVQPQW